MKNKSETTIASKSYQKQGFCHRAWGRRMHVDNLFRILSSVPVSENISALLRHIYHCFGSSEKLMLKQDKIIVIIKIISSVKEEILWAPRPGPVCKVQHVSPRSSQQSPENYCPGKCGNGALRRHSQFSAHWV